MSIERWKKYLRYDPTRWLLETNDPSLLLWYQLDIADRPEDAPRVMETRERVLYSEPVQTIFAAQNAMGFWGEPENLSQPHYTATLWNLALLAELGIPRASRRARNACEFVLQNFLTEDGTFAELNAMESGYLLRAFGYFNYANDARVLRAARTLRERVDSYTARVTALWGWRAFVHDREIEDATRENVERVLNEARTGNAAARTGNAAAMERNAAARTGNAAAMERNAAAMERNAAALTGNAAASVPYTFPQFEPRDELFVLRVVSEYDRVNDARLAPLMDALVSKQNERAQWTLERDLNAQLVTPFERAGEPSRWITLNALRVVVKLVMRETENVMGNAP